MTKIIIDSKWYGDDAKIQGKKVINKSAFETGLIVEGTAKGLAPVNFGYLAASITTQSKTDGTRPDSPKRSASPKGLDPGMPENMTIDKPTDENEVHVGTPVEYAPYIEFGTIRTPGQAFLRPALDLAKGETLRILEENGKKFLQRFTK